MGTANVTLLGVDYNAVPSVLLPKQGGGQAQFDETTIASDAASASDILSGKKAYVNGSLVTGTSQGGSSNWTLIKTGSVSINTTSTSASTATTLVCDSNAWTKDDIIWVRIRGNSGKRNGYFYGSDAIFANSNAANNDSTTFSSPAIQYIRVNSNGTYTATTGSYGVYAYSIASDYQIVIRRRYSSSLTLTLNDTFSIEVYKLSMPTGKTLFA